MINKKIALLGVGEVGSAIRKLAEEAGFDVLVRDLNQDNFRKEKGIFLHVCIPYKSALFLDIVAKAAKDLRPGFIIIHSTVKPGTTQKVYELTKVPAAHSPIRGDHPDLYKSIKEDFVKYVSGVNRSATKIAVSHLREIGIKNVKTVENPINTELAKLVNTFSYTWSIILCKEIAALSEGVGANFDFVYTEFLKTYNEGYEKDKPWVKQPILKATKGEIGGHCLIPNTKLLKDFDKHGFTDFALKQNEKYKKENK